MIPDFNAFLDSIDEETMAQVDTRINENEIPFQFPFTNDNITHLSKSINNHNQNMFMQVFRLYHEWLSKELENLNVDK